MYIVIINDTPDDAFGRSNDWEVSKGEDAHRRSLYTEVRRNSPYASFTTFDAGNDPHGEHDFGALAFGAERYFWKIDYYDADLTFASPDPADPTVTRRVMTIMRADEY